MHCQFFLSFTPDMRTYLRTKLRGHKTTITTDPLTIDKLNPKTEVLGIFVDSKIDKKVFQKLPKLKIILTLSTGYDQIDLKEAKKRNIIVCNVPSYGENTVAEFAIMLMLSINRKLFASIKRVKEGEYDFHGLRGQDIKGKTIGIIGTGNIGQQVINMLKGFDVHIIAFDVFPKKELQKELHFTYVSLNTLLKKSDIISLHVPLFDSTYHMINKKAFKKMKSTAFIINTARGGLIHSEDLVWALEHNQIAGAGLDVLEGEDLLEDTLKLLCNDCSTEDTRLSLMNNIIIDHNKTIVTPHNAFNSTEAIKRIIDTTIQNLKQYIKHDIINNVVE
jgi:D-lactate dehydrogenase